MNALQEKLSEFEKIGAAQPVVLATSAGKTGEGVTYVRQWSAKQRMLRAAMTLAGIWGLAVVAVFIPVLHFILVPLLLILGPIMASAAYHKHSVVLGGLARCPNCSQEVEIVRSADRWPLSDICSACHQHVAISKISKSL